MKYEIITWGEFNYYKVAENSNTMYLARTTNPSGYKRGWFTCAVEKPSGKERYGAGFTTRKAAIECAHCWAESNCERG